MSELLIYKAFNRFKNDNDTDTPENEYTTIEELKTQSTYIPSNRTNFDDTWKGIYQQLKIEL